MKKDLEDHRFRIALLAEICNAMVAGELELGKRILREYIKGTVGFAAIGEALGKSPDSLARMLGPQGNPTARNLFDMVAHLQKLEGGHLQVKFVRTNHRAAA